MFSCAVDCGKLTFPGQIKYFLVLLYLCPALKLHYVILAVCTVSGDTRTCTTFKNMESFLFSGLSELDFCLQFTIMLDKHSIPMFCQNLQLHQYYF